MIKRLFSVILFLSFSGLVFGQKITINIPDNANSEYCLLFNKGLQQDTVQCGHFSFTGTAVITIPEEYKDYAGVAVLQVPDKKAHMFIVNHENFTMDYDGTNYTFKNSPENNFLYGALKNQSVEKDTTLYAGKFLEIIQYMNSLNTVASGQSTSLEARYQIQQYVTEKLDMEVLYTSSLWFHVIDPISKLGTQEAFGNTMVKILKRTRSQKVFEGLAEDLLMIVNQYAWDDAFDIIIPYIAESGRIGYPQGNMYAAFTQSKLRKGMEVPLIEGLEKPLKAGEYANTILFFYESDCPNCRLEVNKLIETYPKLKEKNIRLITISADHNKEDYEKMSSKFLWPDQLCDFQSFGGPNFINYGILGTPTYFLLDKDNKVVGRYGIFESMKF